MQVVLELCHGGALDDILLDLEQGLNESQIKAITRQIVEGLVHLHASSVIHRDLKAGNLLLTANGLVKITDFGVSALNKKHDQRRDTFIGTPYWMAPEVVVCENLRDKPYTYSADIWSLGITLIELAEMSPPFHDMHPMRVLFKIPKSAPPKLTTPENWSPEFNDFLAKCLVKDPASRATAEELAAHPFVTDAVAKSLAPVKDLVKLSEADVIEVLEDLDDGDANDESTIQEDESSQDESSRKQSTTSALEVPTEASSSNFKTLTRTRTFVNDAGETVTVKTQRIVETNLASGKAMTHKRGEASPIQDWQMLEQKRLAILRKQQLRETKMLQRDEQKECMELIARLKQERDALDERQKKTIVDAEKDFEKMLNNHSRHCKSDMEKLEKKHQAKLAAETKNIKARQVRELKTFRSQLADKAKAELSGTAKEDQKLKREEIRERDAEKEKAFIAEQDKALEADLRELAKKQRTACKNKEEELLQVSEDLKSRQAQTMYELGERHLLEKHQMLKHQLKATFLMSKHQMHYRHEKEIEQLCIFQEKKLGDLQKRFDSERRVLPKRLKDSYARDRKSLKRSLSKSDQKSRLAEFDTEAKRKQRAEQSKVFSTYEDAIETLKRSMSHELEELHNAHNAKKQLLVNNESQQIAELDDRNKEELREYRATLEQIRNKLQDEFMRGRERLNQFYGQQSSDSITLPQPAHMASSS
eukprot:m.66347 g.66347  ORF g.66347 m.66347 type:complete len:705 (+) comp7619_c0_seq1:408-2522(+)